MDPLTISDEVTSSVEAKRMFKALIIDAQNLIPKLMPQAIKNIQLVQGDGGPGSIQELTIVQGSETKHLKHRIDAIDKENLTYSYSVIEGDKAESVSYDIKFEPTPEGGCKSKSVSKFYPKQGVEIKEEDIKASKEESLAVFKVVEAYLVANPEAYA
ncbi:hypothetical protein HN51_004355 [Arachis hypogaea]|uniref:Major allergen Pru ar 1 n=1 Tax=Arachis duranensis TaxID=130453 RepID=A0A6P4D0V7_ARADU|nr:major allergen Pru ar 1 [Arachis duranensis]XP_025694606.1 major allergen Pru ar 1 [Arachis hypogaea]XP_057755180.1 major allergen Pru ar 1-like [Arachis stenosperma]QHO37674.1 Major allergen Pru ar [Arachis hypogaea]